MSRLQVAVLATILLAFPAAAEPCRKPGEAAARPGRNPTSCPPPAPRKVEPYDPDRARAGSRPGFIDLGGGTEVRIGGRARMDYDVRR